MFSNPVKGLRLFRCEAGPPERLHVGKEHVFGFLLPCQHGDFRLLFRIGNAVNGGILLDCLGPLAEFIPQFLGNPDDFKRVFREDNLQPEPLEVFRQALDGNPVVVVGLVADAPHFQSLPTVFHAVEGHVQDIAMAVKMRVGDAPHRSCRQVDVFTPNQITGDPVAILLPAHPNPRGGIAFHFRDHIQVHLPKRLNNPVVLCPGINQRDGLGGIEGQVKAGPPVIPHSRSDLVAQNRVLIIEQAHKGFIHDLFASQSQLFRALAIPIPGELLPIAGVIGGFLLRPFPREIFFRFLGRFGGVDAKDHNDLLAVATGDLPVFEAGDDIRVF